MDAILYTTDLPISHIQMTTDKLYEQKSQPVAIDLSSVTGGQTQNVVYSMCHSADSC